MQNINYDDKQQFEANPLPAQFVWLNTDANHIKNVVNANADEATTGAFFRYRGEFDASDDLFPESGGTGTAGAILAGNAWLVTIPGILDGVAVAAGSLIFALIHNPGQDAENWYIIKPGVTSWSDAEAGAVERSTQAEAEEIAARVAAGSVGTLSDDRTPSEIGLFQMLVSLLTKALTWAAKQTFTSAPRFNSTTASQFLGVDSNKDLVSHAEASQAEMITGTAQNRVVTPKAAEDKGSVKLRSFSNSATGTNNIDCLNQDTVHVVFATTLTGANEITLSNAGNLQILSIILPVTGSNIAITLPSTTRGPRSLEVSSGDGWYQSTKVLQVSSVGTADLHEISLKRAKADGTIFKLEYGDPSRA